MKRTFLSQAVLQPVVRVVLVLLLTASCCWAQEVNPFADGPMEVRQSATVEPDQTGIANLFSAKNLTEEEHELMALKLLPSWYPTIKEAMEGPLGSLQKARKRARDRYPYKNAVFSTHFGEPPHMLEWARRYRNDAAMVKLCQSTQRGDILLNGHRTAEGQKKDMIAILTGGQYHHAVVVIDGPPCIFIEAVGATGAQSDPTNNRVRISAWHEYLANWAAFRLLRPTAGLPEAEAKRLIGGAVSYAVAQLGKPYDYGFTNSDASRAFYCSELAWKCYHDGAGWKEFMPVKSSARDRVVVALNNVVEAMEPYDRVGLANRVVAFAREYTSQKPVDVKKLEDFIVDELAPGCKAFTNAYPTPEARERLRGVLTKVRTNQAFPRYLEATKAFAEAKKAGKFDTGWGIGTVRKLAAEAKIVAAIAADANGLVKDSGAGWMKIARLLGTVIVPMYKNMGTYADLLTGMDRQGNIDLPEGAKTVLSMTDWLADKREAVKQWPVVGPGLASLLPGNGDDRVQRNFTSPTDLAETSPNFTLNYP